METQEFNGLITLLSRFLGEDEKRLLITDRAAMILAQAVLTVLRDKPPGDRAGVISRLNEGVSRARHQTMQETQALNSFANQGEQLIPILDERAIEALVNCINFPEMASTSV